MRMQNNVYGVLGIAALDANWNAGFDGIPKSLPDGTIFGSDKALKYCFREFWQQTGERVLYKKSKKSTKDGNIVDVTLEERYNTLFNKNLKSIDNKSEVLQDILTAIDARQFGFTFAVQQKNLDGTGPVQFGLGRNINKTSQVFIQDILSPFVAEKKDGKNSEKSTLGTRTDADQVNYAYPFCINPKALCSEYSFEVSGGEYTIEDYEKFKRAAAICANVNKSCTKFGAQNEYLLIVETKNDMVYLNNLARYVDLDEDTLVLDRLMGYLELHKDQIDTITIWYDGSILNVGNYPNLIKKDLSELQ